MGEKRQRPARMGQDEPDIRIAFHYPLKNQVHRHPRGLERIVDQHAGDIPAVGLGAGRIARVNEDDSLAPVQFGIERLEIRMPDIFIVNAGQQGDAVEL